jgi:hypothetical protein
MCRRRISILASQSDRSRFADGALYEPVQMSESKSCFHAFFGQNGSPTDQSGCDDDFIDHLSCLNLNEFIVDFHRSG